MSSPHGVPGPTQVISGSSLGILKPYAVLIARPPHFMEFLGSSYTPRFHGTPEPLDAVWQSLTGEFSEQYAAKSGRSLLTHNRRHFRRLRRDWLNQGKHHCGDPKACFRLGPWSQQPRQAIRITLKLSGAHGQPSRDASTAHGRSGQPLQRVG